MNRLGGGGGFFASTYGRSCYRRSVISDTFRPTQFRSNEFFSGRNLGLVFGNRLGD